MQLVLGPKIVVRPTVMQQDISSIISDMIILYLIIKLQLTGFKEDDSMK